MRLKPLNLDYTCFPTPIQQYLRGATLYDSSCSPHAQVIYLAKDHGYFLKIAKANSLQREAELTTYFHSLKLAPCVLEYLSDPNYDYLLTEKISGHDCIEPLYLANPKRLCDTLAERLAILHQYDFTDCPIANHTEHYLNKIEENYQKRQWDLQLFPAKWAFASPETAYKIVQEKKQLLQTDTLLHGDYCLPNVILDAWQFSGFVDLDSGGVGDRHIDIFWGTWTLNFNLKTDHYRERFYDAYGRAKIDLEKLELVAACEVFG